MLLRVASFFVLVLLFQVAVAKFSLPKETKRRCQHALTGLGLLQISYHLPLPLCIAALASGCLAIAYVRFCQKLLYEQLFEPLLRPEELQQGALPGAFYFLLGTLLTAALFPLPDARYAVACVSLADPAASWAGTSIPSPRITSRASVAGCLACFFTALSLGMMMFHVSLQSAVVASLACALAEAFPMVNDNLSIPLMTALALYVQG